VRQRSVWFLLVGLTACGTAAGRGYPLYPNPDHPRAPTEIAHLAGPISSVDGVNVADKGRTFVLLPGCHIVVSSTSVGGEGQGGWWSAHLPPYTWPFRMKAGHRYKIEVDREDSSAPVFRVFINASEQDATGARQPVAMAASATDVDNCRNWAP